MQMRFVFFLILLMNYKCVLCFRYIDKGVERYRVEGKGKFDIVQALKSLPFNIRNSTTFICKQCLAKLKKRSGLVQQLSSLDNELKDVYQKNENDSSYPGSEDIEYTSDSCSTPKKKCPPPSTSTPLLEFNREGLSRELAVSPIKTGVKKATNVTVKVNWPSKESSRKLPDDLEPLGKMLLRGTYKQIANSAWKNPDINKNLRELLLKDIEQEAAGLCSKKNPSCIRKTDKANMLSLSLENVSSEIKERAPLLHSVLSTFAINPHSRATYMKPHFGPIAMAAAILLKNRSRYMTAIQLLVTIFLYHSN